jgi:hypothetical protein
MYLTSFIVSGLTLQAEATLQKVASINKKALPPGHLRPLPIDTSKARGKVYDLFTPTLRKSTILIFIFWFLLTYSYYGVTVREYAINLIV